ncbi:unnamed protein product [Acanthoscelides obtectus]|uniref:DUF4706 domain-containing protein n=1 Tax=Acanthoscelides obtectus TaxID=200917 RepID=A0A9P0LED8_ACAOB|nr:unnamed protein product [Acanthoscelides obtectus]CAK1676387.1 hypothetical protein AOBTE_LOCUS30727 [Acanthoscelides obtectus]
MSLKSAAENYFSSINPIASRLYSDLNEIKSSYEDLWNTLPEKEQQEILTDSIIKPEISIKYLKKEEKPRTDYAVNFIHDGTCSYRDEHSGPFSFKTRSQRDLRLFHPEEKPTSKPEAMSKAKAKSKPFSATYQDVKSEAFAEVTEVNKNTNSLPKTGLDFLDNW